MSQPGKTIRVTEEQHKSLERVKTHLKNQLNDDINLAQSSWEPTHSDAVQFILERAREAELAQQEDDEGLPEDHPWHPSNQD